MGNWSKKLGSSLLIGGLSLGLLSPSAFASDVQPSKGKTSEFAPIDMNVVDQDRLAKALKDRGLIAKNASKVDTAKAVQKYIERKNEKQAEPKTSRLLLLKARKILIKKQSLSSTSKRSSCPRS